MRQDLNNTAAKKRTLAMERWWFSHPWKCIGKLNSNLFGRVISRLGSWNVVHGRWSKNYQIVCNGVCLNVCECMFIQSHFSGGRIQSFPSYSQKKKKKKSKWIQTSGIHSTNIYSNHMPGCVLGTKNIVMAMDIKKMNSGHLLT